MTLTNMTASVRLCCFCVVSTGVAASVWPISHPVGQSTKRVVELRDLQGQWTFESAEHFGSKTKLNPWDLRFDGEKCFSVVNGDDVYYTLWKIAAGTDPIEFDLFRPDPDGGKVDVLVGRGILRVEDDKLIRCIRMLPASRPKTFDINKETDALLTVHSRMKTRK